MTFFRRGRLLLWLLVLAAPMNAFAKDRQMIEVTVVEQLNINRLVESLVVNAISVIEKTSFEAPKEINDDHFSDKATAFMARLYHQRWGEMIGRHVLLQDDTKISITKWRAAPDNPFIKSFTLWDASDYKLLLIEVDNVALSSAAKARDLIEQTLITKNSPLDVHVVEFSILGAPKQVGIIGTGFVNYISMPAGGLKGYEFDIASFVTRDRSYLVYKTGKRVADI